MCDVGKPLEVIDSQPVILPAPLHKETVQPTEQHATVEVPVSERTLEPVTVAVERS